MENLRFQFDSVERLGVVSRGKPGHRTFYVFAGDDRSWARFWMEKEELQMLAVAIDEVLESFPEKEELDREPAQHLIEPTEPPSVEFKVTRLALAYDESRGRVGLLAFETPEEGDEEQPPIVSCWATREQAEHLSEQIQEVVAAGRPICRLCGGPIDPEGHVCPRLNGHRNVRPE
ncbi:MAG: DUF3090 family protein [Chloroflexota bacterium]|nr:MAG: DUF3090 family protein [Chloroflexota bacterium]